MPEGIVKCSGLRSAFDSHIEGYRHQFSDQHLLGYIDLSLTRYNFFKADNCTLHKTLLGAGSHPLITSVHLFPMNTSLHYMQ
jgi:hypothetical protein